MLQLRWIRSLILRVPRKLSREIDDTVQELINNEERGQEYMTMQVYMAEQKVEGGYERAVGSVRRWLETNSRFPIDEYAALIDVTVPEFEEIVSLIKEHPDWYDEAISEEIAWY